MIKLFLTFITTMFLVACGSDDSSNNNSAKVATTPLHLSCINGQAHCDNSQYYQHQGFMPYPGMYNYAYDYSAVFINRGLCGCPVNFAPTYNDSYGLGCVRSSQIQVYSATVSNWSYAYGFGYGFYVGMTSTSYYTPAPQMQSNYVQQSNIVGNGLHQASCQAQITQSCFMDQANSCGERSQCRPVFNQGRLGICVKI